MDPSDYLSGTEYINWVNLGRPNIDNPGASMLHQIRYGPNKPIDYYTPKSTNSFNPYSSVSRNTNVGASYPLLNLNRRKNISYGSVANNTVSPPQDESNQRTFWKKGWAVSKKGAALLWEGFVRAAKAACHPVGAALLTSSLYALGKYNYRVSLDDFFPLLDFLTAGVMVTCMVGLPAAGIAAAFRKGARLIAQKPRTANKVVDGCLWGAGALLALALYGTAYQEGFFLDRLAEAFSPKGGRIVISETTASLSVPLKEPSKRVRLPKSAYKKTAHL